MSYRGCFAKACLAALLAPMAASASDGGFDPAFGTGGVVPFRGQMYGSPVVGVEPDGRIVICDARQHLPDPLFNFALARFLADGSVDESFGVQGAVNLPFDGTANNICGAVAFQADGKIVFAGSRYRGGFGGPSFMVGRVAADGTIDDTFGHGAGFVEIGFGSPAVEGIARVVKIDPEGRILVAGGATTDGEDFDFVAARLLPSGDLDKSFNGTGRYAFVSSQTQDIANGLVLDREGRVILAGNLAGAALLIRLMPDGAIDKEFGYHGFAMPLGIGSAESLLIDEAGRCVIAGTHAYFANRDMSAARLLSDGTLDLSFGSGGLQDIPFDLATNEPGVDRATSVVEGPGGSLVLLGRAEYGESDGSGYHSYAAAARLGKDGEIDSTFGIGGKMTFAFGPSPPDQQGFYSAAIAAGRVVTVGSFNDTNSQYSNDVVVRLENDRVFVGTFGD